MPMLKFVVVGLLVYAGCSMIEIKPEAAFMFALAAGTIGFDW